MGNRVSKVDPLTEIELRKIAEEIQSEWKKLGLELNFTWADIINFKTIQSPAERNYSMLKTWHQKLSDDRIDTRQWLNRARKSASNVKLETGSLSSDLFLYSLSEYVQDYYETLSVYLGVAENDIKTISQKFGHCPVDAAIGNVY